MDELVYACPSHGTVVVITRRELPVAHPPLECPWCQGALRSNSARGHKSHFMKVRPSSRHRKEH